ncbi:hypothetical protein [Lederbergia graminis]|uniref:Uncharacterized protein n=1 Tax=Lederbergia graminis TaxID=735518 RepID=A0ABW0LGK4_9BACI|nr:hypothetical protein [Paenibacillus bovis]
MPFADAVVDLETELTNALSAIIDDADPDRIERFVRLLIKKEIVLKLIIMDVNRF